MAKYLILAALTILSGKSFAIVDMKNANYADSWIDYESNGTGYKLKVQRTYNSRSTYDGIFGYGWCSDFETKLEIMPDSSLKVIECGGGMEISYTSGKVMTGAELKAYIKKLVSLSQKVNPRLDKNYLKRLEKDLGENQYLREALALKLGLKGKIENNSVFYARGRAGEKIAFKDNTYTRQLSDGTYQKFDSKGKLTAFFDRNSNFLKFVYNGENLVQIMDNNARRLDFSYYPNGKVKQIKTPDSPALRYTYSGQDLASAFNAWKMTYTHKYDKLHNITYIGFPDNTNRQLTYDENKDLVISFKDRNNCNESYKYTGSKEDPRNHYWSEVVKQCGGKVTNKSKYEFWHRSKSDGTGKYLYRVRSENNDDIVDITYHDIFGKPLVVKENKHTTWYQYNRQGLVVERKTPVEKLSYNYDSNCNKVSATTTEHFRSLANKDEVTRSRRSKYGYDKQKCNLVYGVNSTGTKVRIGYDRYGRISKLIDQSQKYVKLTYDEKAGKPKYIERPGLGKIQIIYDDKGEMADVKSSSGPDVAAQIATVFNSLLEVVAPAMEDGIGI